MFVGVLGLHFLWFSRYGPQARWISLDDEQGLSLQSYSELSSLWLGLRYAGSFERTERGAEEESENDG